ncbi:hypothetical protein HY357_04930 [Candidatus Roizmanbacteria bacterium]|nr:hypothetical protein [Candidatus Roizmanbacteria bacterium]
MWICCEYACNWKNFSRSDEIEACSLVDEPHEEVWQELGRRLHFEGIGIRQYLNTAQPFDMLLFAATGLILTPEVHELLVSKIKPRGYILGVGYPFVSGSIKAPLIPIDVTPSIFRAYDMHLWQMK